MKMNKIFLMFLLIITSSTIMGIKNNPLTPVSTSSGFKHNNPIVIFDASHQQFFNHTFMQSALDYIEDTFEAQIIINEDPYTLTSLRGADLLIQLAPSINASGSGVSGPFTDIEKRAVKEFADDGGSILFLANPLFLEEAQIKYSSNLPSINYLIGEYYSGLTFTQQYNLLLDDFKNAYDDERFIKIDNSTMLNGHPIIKGLPEDDPVNDILAYSTELLPTASGVRVINTSESTYSIDDNLEIQTGSLRRHNILAAQEKASSRGISCSSAIMFSDFNITGSPYTWYEAADNSILWKNIINWLFYQTPVVEQQLIIPNFGYFALGGFLLFLFFIVLGVILYTVGKESKKVTVSETLSRMREKEGEVIEEEIDEEEEIKIEDIVEEKEEEKEEEEVDMESISEEVRRKSPRKRSRSIRRKRKRD